MFFVVLVPGMEMSLVFSLPVLVLLPIATTFVTGMSRSVSTCTLRCSKPPVESSTDDGATTCCSEHGGCKE